MVVWIPNKKVMFDHLMRCRFFTIAAFDSDCFNHAYQKRTKRRKVFIEFQEYIAGLPEKNIVCDDNFIELFDKVLEKEAINAKIATVKLHQEKFSGQMFMRYVEPRLINKHKEGFHQWLRGSTVEEVEVAISRYFNNL